jgi:hypothetical protein
MSELKYALCVCIVGAVLAAAGARAQAPAPGQPSARQPSSDHSHAADATASSRPESQQPAAESAGDQRQTMMEVEAIEAELDLLVAKMNESEGKSKLEAMEKLLTTLVRQHRAVCGGMMRSPEQAATGGCCQGKGSPARPDTP